MLIYPKICGPYLECFNYWIEFPCQGRNSSDFPVQFTACPAGARNEGDLDFNLYYFCIPKYLMYKGQTETEDSFFSSSNLGSSGNVDNAIIIY